jgi:serine protease Do
MLKTAVLVTALMGAAAIGASVAPVAHGQTAIKTAPHAVQIFGGGSRIGITIQDIEAAEPGSVKGTTSGVVVEDVAPDGPAAKAGIQKGDIVVEFDGERVRSARQLTRLVQETPSGRSVAAVVLRNGQRTNLTVTPSADRFDIGRLKDLRGLARDFHYGMPTPVPPTPPAPPGAPVPPSVWDFGDLMGRSGGRLGITVSSLSPQLAEYFGTKDGVLVSSVADGSAAAKAGLKAGDVITSIGGTEVDDPSDVRRAVQDAKDGEELTIGLTRDRKAMTLKATIEREERRPSGRTVL